jgi:hypothetical protein
MVEARSGCGSWRVIVRDFTTNDLHFHAIEIRKHPCGSDFVHIVELIRVATAYDRQVFDGR